jgi:hypothetical protein
MLVHDAIDYPMLRSGHDVGREGLGVEMKLWRRHAGEGRQMSIPLPMGGHAA